MRDNNPWESEKSDYPQQYDESLTNEYLKISKVFKYRRLAATAVLSLLLLISLFIINANGWSNLVGGEKIGGTWITVGIGVSICAVGVVILDLILRRNQ